MGSFFFVNFVSEWIDWKLTLLGKNFDKDKWLKYVQRVGVFILYFTDGNCSNVILVVVVVVIIYWYKMIMDWLLSVYVWLKLTVGELYKSTLLIVMCVLIFLLSTKT